MQLGGENYQLERKGKGKDDHVGYHREASCPAEVNHCHGRRA